MTSERTELAQSIVPLTRESACDGFCGCPPGLYVSPNMADEGYDHNQDGQS